VMDFRINDVEKDLRLVFKYFLIISI